MLYFSTLSRIYFNTTTTTTTVLRLFIIIIIIIIKNEKIKVTLCKNAAGALYIFSKMCVDGQRKVQG